MFKNRKVLVAGGTGLIGIPLVKLLLSAGARVRIASLDDQGRAHPDAEFMQLDLRSYANCLKACAGMDYVFNLLCTKAPPMASHTEPNSLLGPMLQFNTNMISAAYYQRVDGYLFTSSVGVYGQGEILKEEDTMTKVVSYNDRFAGSAKRIGELQIEAFRIQYQWSNTAIVRPANTYGPYDNFSGRNAMAIPYFIKKIVDGNSPIVIQGDGEQIRDFIHADDVASGMLIAARCSSSPLNLGSGIGTSIKELVQMIINLSGKSPEVIYDTSSPSGDRKRLLDTSAARMLGFEPKIKLEQGIGELIEWYQIHRNDTDSRFDFFK